MRRTSPSRHAAAPLPSRRAALPWAACLALGMGASSAVAQPSPATPAAQAASTPASAAGREGDATEDASTAQPARTQRVEIIGTSPLPGQGVARELLPYNTRVMGREALQAGQAPTLSDHLLRHLPGAQVSDIQGSPWQGDVTLHGYHASGLLGVAQGVSVYLDGVRINEPFADIVNWDLLPEFDVDSIALSSGANPAFGLNTLGGALSLRTATGRRAPGWRAQAGVGAFGRSSLSLSHGGASEGSGWSHYLSASSRRDGGWRERSPSRISHVLGKLGHRGEAGDFTASVLLAKSQLYGNGLLPLATLDETGAQTPDMAASNWRSVYTHPDITDNRLTQASLQWQRALEDGSLVEALAYVRHSDRHTLNGDAAELDEVVGSINAALNRAEVRQRGWGFSAAWSGKYGAHQWQLGATLDAARMRYSQTEQEGSLTTDRGVTAGDEPPELSVDVTGSARSLGLYATDTIALTPGTHLTATLRLNHARVGNTLTSVDDDTNLLTARPHEAFTYRSVNPALGLTQRLAEGFSAYANLARNTRNPTVIELGCADPQEPCRLPVGMQSDPYLAAVVATSMEAGVRWRLAGTSRIEGTLGVFRTDNRNDILFRSLSTTGQLGYFANFPRTRHQGVEASIEGKLGGEGRPITWQAAYTHLRATYEAHGVLRQGARNVTITPGTPSAGLPRHQLKLSADWRVSSEWALGADVQAVSRRGVAGNEDGLLEDDGEHTLHLHTPGYALTNLRASWSPAAWPGLELALAVTNATNRRAISYGALGETLFDAQGNYMADEREALFVAPGAPRAWMLTARLAW